MALEADEARSHLLEDLAAAVEGRKRAEHALEEAHFETRSWPKLLVVRLTRVELQLLHAQLEELRAQASHERQVASKREEELYERLRLSGISLLVLTIRPYLAAPMRPAIAWEETSPRLLSDPSETCGDAWELYFRHESNAQGDVQALMLSFSAQCSTVGIFRARCLPIRLRLSWVVEADLLISAHVVIGSLVLMSMGPGHDLFECHN
ncbi:MAG: hypothetical protein SGPRY_003557 [Prymnesium sp.]